MNMLQRIFQSCLLTIVIIVTACVLRTTCIETNGVDLYKHLFENGTYTSAVRPLKNDSTVLNVIVKFLLRGISEFNEVSGQLSTAMALDLRWKDEFIHWNPKTEFPVKTLVLPEDNVWVPRLSLVNPTDRIVLFEEDPFSVRIYPDGSIIWLQGGTIHSKCRPNVYKYPFDVHTCTITVVPLNYVSWEINLIPDIDNVMLNNFGEWEMIGTEVENFTFSFFSAVNLHMTIKRKPEFALYSILLPIMSLGILNACVFLLPVESGERVSYGITVLLSFAVFLTIINGMMPKNSSPVPVLCYVLTTMMAASGLIMFFVILGLRCFYQDASLPVPKYLLRLSCKRVRSLEINGIISDAAIPMVPRDNSNCIELQEITWQDVSHSLDVIFFRLFMALFGVILIVYLVIIIIL